MKFQPDRSSAPTITGFGPGWFSVDADRYTSSLVLSSSGNREVWNCQRFEDLTPEHFALLARFDAEVVLFGSGLRNRFVPPAWLRPLIERRIGLETMDTAAAFRTYNILAGEGRTVVAALLLESSPATAA
ncbi:MAG: Mth938-like domain-containing protein [Burkholderiaceae bacterium]